MDSFKSNLILTGMPGSGKTTLGKKVAKKLCYNFCDFDDDVLEKITLGNAMKIHKLLNLENKGIKPNELIRRKVSELLSILGDDDFIKLEGLIGKSLEFKEPTVLSCSGSLPLSTEAMEHLGKKGDIIYIDIPIELIVSRLSQMKVDRIVGIGEKSIEEILKYRLGYYDLSKDVSFEVPSFSTREDKNQEKREIEKTIIFNQFINFYEKFIKNKGKNRDF